MRCIHRRERGHSGVNRSKSFKLVIGGNSIFPPDVMIEIYCVIYDSFPDIFSGKVASLIYVEICWKKLYFSAIILTSGTKPNWPVAPLIMYKCRDVTCSQTSFVTISWQTQYTVFVEQMEGMSGNICTRLVARRMNFSNKLRSVLERLCQNSHPYMHSNFYLLYYAS